MLSVSETGELLGVSCARVRAMLKAGQLEGVKIGRAWGVSESSVQKRLRDGAHPGRPARKRVGFERGVPDAEAAHQIYDQAQQVLAGCYDTDFLKLARSREEQAFWICVADFFLQQRQRELVREGVF